MLHDMFVHFSPDLGGYTIPVQGTENETLTPGSLELSLLAIGQGFFPLAIGLSLHQPPFVRELSWVLLRASKTTTAEGRIRNVGLSKKGGPICFTICLFISPDLDGHRATICFTICLFISPDLDGMFHDMFVH